MRRFGMLAVFFPVLLSACSGSPKEIPTIGTDWLITLESVSRIGEADFPVSVEITLRVKELGATNSGPAPDGTRLSLTAVYTETEVERTIQTVTHDGLAQVTLVFEAPDGADCTAEVGETILVFKLEVDEAAEVQISD